MASKHSDENMEWEDWVTILIVFLFLLAIIVFIETTS
jgi:hypothetical protein